MERSSKYKLLFAVHDHCEFAEVSVASVNPESSTAEDLPTLQTTDDAWAIPHARNGMIAAVKTFGIRDEKLRISSLRVTISDSTPDNIAVAAFISTGIYVGKIFDPNTFIDSFIRDGRIRFPQNDDQLRDWLNPSP